VCECVCVGLITFLPTACSTSSVPLPGTIPCPQFRHTSPRDMRRQAPQQIQAQRPRFTLDYVRVCACAGFAGCGYVRGGGDRDPGTSQARHRPMRATHACWRPCDTVAGGAVPAPNGNRRTDKEQLVTTVCA
jgi:hypothetical protein